MGEAAAAEPSSKAPVTRRPREDALEGSAPVNGVKRTRDAMRRISSRTSAPRRASVFAHAAAKGVEKFGWLGGATVVAAPPALAPRLTR